MRMTKYYSPCALLRSVKTGNKPALSFEAGNDQAASTLDDLLPIGGARERFETVKKSMKENTPHQTAVW